MTDLRDLERQTFKAAKDDGLWDVLVAGFLLIFAIGPLLSESLGDFWSSAVFLPIWLAFWLAVRAIRVHYVRPRIGTIEVGDERQVSLTKAAVALVVLNLVALALGLLAWLGFPEDWFGAEVAAYPIMLGLIVIGGFGVAAFFTGIRRFAAYGPLIATAVLAGEWMWQEGLVEHHGFPLMFGAVSLLIFTIGVFRLVRLLRANPSPDEAATV